MSRIFTKFLSCYIGLILAVVSVSASAYQLSPESFNNFYAAASEGDAQTIVNAQHRGLDINSTNANGDTALCVAIKRHDYLAYRTLVRLGAATNHECVDNIPSYAHKSFLNDYNSHYRITSGTESTGWGKKGAALVLGAGAAAGVVALLSSGGGGGHHSSDDNSVCKQNKCAEGCYTNVTCSIGQQCAQTNECGGCDRCETAKECAENKCAEGCYTNIECGASERCVSTNSCGGCERCSTRNECILNRCAKGCFENITCKSNETCSARNDCGGCTACTAKDQPIITIPIDNCEVYNSDDELCYACSDQFMLIAGHKACMSVDKKIEHCADYNLNEKCTGCVAGYQLVNDPAEGLKCIEKIENCVMYNVDGSCRQCAQEYILSPSKTSCIKTIENCISYFDNGTCQTCNSGYSPNKTSTRCSRTIDKCVDYDSEGKCIECLSGYEPSSNGSYCVSHIEHCTNYNQSHTLCLTCEIDYVPSNNRTECIHLTPINIPYCKEYTDEYHVQCKECYGGYEVNPINQLSCNRTEGIEPGSSELYVSNNSEITTPVANSTYTKDYLDGSNDIIGFTALPDERLPSDPSKDENPHFFRTGDADNYNLYDIYNSYKGENGPSTIKLNISSQTMSGSIKGMATTDNQNIQTQAVIFNGYGNTSGNPAKIEITYSGNNYNVYGIYGHNIVYNSYTSYNPATNIYRDGYGEIKIITNSQKDENYGIYAKIAAYNAAGGTGNIILSASNNNTIISNHVGIDASTVYNAYVDTRNFVTANDEIISYSRDYTGSIGNITLEKGGIGIRGEYIYNAYSNTGNASSGTITIKNTGTGMMLKDSLTNGGAYNAYGKGANGRINIINTENNTGSNLNLSIYGMYSPYEDGNVPLISAAAGGISNISITNNFNIDSIIGIYNGDLDDSFKNESNYSIGHITITETGNAKQVIGIENGTMNDPSTLKSTLGSSIRINIKGNYVGRTVYGIKSVSSNPSGYIEISDTGSTIRGVKIAVYGIENDDTESSFNNDTKINIKFENEQNTESNFYGLKSLNNCENNNVQMEINGGNIYGMYSDIHDILNEGSITTKGGEKSYGMYSLNNITNNGTLNTTAKKEASGLSVVSDSGSSYDQQIISAINNGNINISPTVDAIDFTGHGIYAKGDTSTNNMGTISIKENADSTSSKLTKAYGIYFKGTKGDVSNGNIITINSSADNANLYGIYVKNEDYSQTTTQIYNKNQINLTSKGNNAILYGIYSNGNNGTLFNNHGSNISINGYHNAATQGTKSYGIYYENSNYPSSDYYNVINNGSISLNGDEVYGIYTKNANILNNGKISVIGINIPIGSDSNGDYYKQEDATISADSNINGLSGAEKIYGIYAEGGIFVNAESGNIQLAGTKSSEKTEATKELHAIHLVNANGYNKGVIGANMHAQENNASNSAVIYLSNSSFVNLPGGKIYMTRKGNGVSNRGYVFIALNNSKYYNYGIIRSTDSIINSSNNSNLTNENRVKNDDSSNFYPDDTTQSDPTLPQEPDMSPLNISSVLHSKFVMMKGSRLEASAISGTISAGTDIVNEGFANEYTNDEALIGDVSKVDIISDSLLFNASLRPNADNDNAADIVMTMKSFAEVTPDDDLADYLQINYENQNAEEALFKPLKQATNDNEYRENLYKSLGIKLLPNFAQENFNVFRSLNNLMINNLYATPMSEERMMVGYDFLALSRSGHKGITGYENNANSSYFIGDIPLDKYSRFGLGVSITRFDSDYDDSSDRDETFAQALASYMYDFKNNWTYAGVLHGGYGFGDYKRYVESNKYEADLHEGVYGLNNELRYTYELPYVTLEPQLEMNFNGYYQNRIKEKRKDGAINVKGTNNLSVENGVGLYASKTFNTRKFGDFKGRLGGSYYHEWAHPYHTMKARLYDTDGYYKIHADDIFDRDRFLLKADITYNYKALDLYVRACQYLEKHNTTVFNAGLKWNF